MSAVSIDKTEEVVSELPLPKGPGARLKAARKARGLTEEAIAEAIFLKLDTLQALENDDFARLPGRVYVSGYLKKYARQVGIPEESIIKALNDFSPEQQKPVTTATHHYKFDTSRDVSTRRGGGFPFFKLLMILLIAAGGYFGWQQQWFSGMSMPAMNLELPGLSLMRAEPDNQSSDAGNIALPMQIETQESIPVESETAALSLPVIDTAEPVVKDSEAVVEMPEPIVETSEPIVVSVVDEVQSTVETIETAENLPVNETTSAMLADTVEPAAEAVAVSNAVTLTFSQVCWVDIRDSSRSYKYINQARPGQTIILGGTAPYKILLGNVRGVEMMVNGQLYDLAQHERANVARFVLEL